MCDVQLENDIKAVISDFINNKKQFTAWDVTRQVRKTAQSPHWEIRGVVRGAWRDGFFPVEYIRTMINLKNGSQTFLYSPVSMKTTDYYAIATDSDVDENDSSDDSTQSSPNDSVKLAPDGRKRICIPSKMIKSLGLSSADTAYIVYDKVGSGIMEIMADSPVVGSYKVVKTYTVDNHNNVRITAKNLTAAGFNSYSNFVEAKVSSDGLRIVLQ